MGKPKRITKDKARELVLSVLRAKDSKDVKAIIGTEAKMNNFNMHLGVLHKQIQAFKLPVPNKRPQKLFIRVSHDGSFEYFPYDRKNAWSQFKVILASALKLETKFTPPMTEELQLAINDALLGTTVATPVNVGEDVSNLEPLRTPFGTAPGETSSEDYVSASSGSETETPNDAQEAGPSQAGPSQAGPSGVTRVPVNALPATRAPKRASRVVSGSDISENDMQTSRDKGTSAKRVKATPRGKGKKPAKKDLLEQQDITSTATDRIAETQDAMFDDEQTLVEMQDVSIPENLLPEQTSAVTMDGNDPAGGTAMADQPILGAGPLVVSGAGALVPSQPLQHEARTDEPPQMQVIEPALLPVIESSSSVRAPESPYAPTYYAPPSMRMTTIDTQRANQQFYAQFNQNNNTYSQINNDNSVNTQNFYSTMMTDARTLNDMRTTVINNGVSPLELDAGLMRLQQELQRQSINNQQFFQYAQAMFMQQNADAMANLLRGNQASFDMAIERVVAQVQDAIEAGLPSSPNSSSSSGESSTGDGGAGVPPPPINAGGDTSIGQPINSMGTTQTPSTSSGGSEQLLRQILEILTIQNADKLRAMALAKNVDQYTPKSSTSVNLPNPQVLPLENARGRRVIDSDYVVIRPRFG